MCPRGRLNPDCLPITSPALSKPMIGESRQLVTDERLKLETSVEIPITLEEFMEYTSNQYRKTEGCQPVGLANTRISTDYAQKSRTLRPLQQATQSIRKWTPSEGGHHFTISNYWLW